MIFRSKPAHTDEKSKSGNLDMIPKFDDGTLEPNIGETIKNTQIKDKGYSEQPLSTVGEQLPDRTSNQNKSKTPLANVALVSIGAVAVLGFAGVKATALSGSLLGKLVAMFKNLFHLK